MYHVRATFATTRRIYSQLSHDHRSLALILVMPVLLMSLLWWVYSDNEMMFDLIGPALLAIFPFFIMFLITSITTLRERMSGTLERVLITPIAKADFILGYLLAFGGLAIIQSLIASSVAIYLLGLDVAGPQWFVVLVALINAVLGVALGLLVSAFARTEFQAVQFTPLIILPQLLLCGLLLPLEQMPPVLEGIARFLPLTYAVEALQHVVTNTSLDTSAWQNLGIIVVFVVAAIISGTLTLRRSEK